MSGGHFDYKQYAFEDIARDIDALVREMHYPEDIIEKFKEAAHEIRRAGDMAERVDYLVSGDDGDDSFRQRWAEDVRAPWNKQKGERKTKPVCTFGKGVCPVHKDGESCAHKVIKPKKPNAYYQEVHDRLWKLRNSNPRWEMVFQEKGTRIDNPDHTPVVEGTMTVLPDGTLAYLFDAGTPHPRDPRLKKG